MSRTLFVSAAVFALAVAIMPAAGGEKASASAADDCEIRMQKLDQSNAEGEERLAAKYEVIDFCARQYRQDAEIGRLVKECAKYVEQPVVKQQFTADCQLAAFAYANALRALKSEYGK